jgi:hypothetical protein
MLNIGMLIVVALIDVHNIPHNSYYQKLAEGKPWRYEYRLLFSLQGGDEFAKLYFIGPILGSVGYSICARLGLRARKRESEADTAAKV